MAQRKNKFGQPIGDDVPDWNAALWPPRSSMHGRFCRLEALDAKKHLDGLYDAYCVDDGRMWTYMPVGPFVNKNEVQQWLKEISPSEDPSYYAIIDSKTDTAIGMASYLRITPTMGTIEVGHIAFSPRLQKTPIATEAMFLMMQRVFDELGYRRYEWKCDSLNAASRRAAERFGFSFDGVFKQAVVYKERNRDTAWFSTIDRDWPALKQAYQQWLAPENFTGDGQQKTRLADVIDSAKTL